MTLPPITLDLTELRVHYFEHGIAANVKVKFHLRDAAIYSFRIADA